jgi:2,3-bisphosphoglycerate-independent phosphoglycerate mutase
MTHPKTFPTMLIILDGFGYTQNPIGNAPAQALMPTWHYFLKKYPSTLLHASGEYVGLLPNCIGNSEVGHLTLGSGRVIKSALKKFHEVIDNGSFFENKCLIEKFKKLQENDQALHLMGLLSDAGVHSHEKHLYALITLAAQLGLKKVYIHPFLDGRDVAPQSAETYLQRLEDLCKKLNCGTIATLHGRFYAMDRDNNWERTQITYNVLTGQDKQTLFSSWQEALHKYYEQNMSEEFLYPCIINSHDTIKKGDGVFFFNFRPDRGRQLTTFFMHNTLQCPLSFFMTTTRFESTLRNQVLFEQEYIAHTLLDELAQHKTDPHHKVILIAETEKYAHVTYFFKGMRDEEAPYEQRILIPSLKIRNYIEHPEMSAPKITEYALTSLRTTTGFFYVINYANADMVGHSGNLQATIKACSILDQQLTFLYKEVVEKRKGTLFITADHGNAETKIDAKTGNPWTAHTTNPVLFVAINEKYKNMTHDAMLTQPAFGLAHVAPTILTHLGIKIPKQMEQGIIF